MQPATRIDPPASLLVDGDWLEGHLEHPGLRVLDVRGRFEGDGEARATADYIAGMTDRFALKEHARLTGWDEELEGKLHA